LKLIRNADLDPSTAAEKREQLEQVRHVDWLAVIFAGFIIAMACFQKELRIENQQFLKFVIWTPLLYRSELRNFTFALHRGVKCQRELEI